jgi:DNA-binding transcriptional MerR regulator
MSKPDRLFYIREIAAAGVSINALRFYEAKGLLQPAHVSPDSGYRYYSLDNFHRLRSIQQLKDAGLSLAEIKDYLDGNRALSEKIALLEKRRALLEQLLENMKLRQEPAPEPAVRITTLPPPALPLPNDSGSEFRPCALRYSCFL